MLRLFAALLLALTAIGPVAIAAPLPQLVVTEVVEIDQRPDAVWRVIGDFGALAKWHPAVESSIADRANRLGSVRSITLRGDKSPTIVEQLLVYDRERRRYTYRINAVDPRVLPVIRYRATLSVWDLPNGRARVVWRGRFDAQPGITPTAASSAVRSVYRTGLDALKPLAERKPAAGKAG